MRAWILLNSGWGNALTSGTPGINAPHWRGLALMCPSRCWPRREMGALAGWRRAGFHWRCWREETYRAAFSRRMFRCRDGTRRTPQPAIVRKLLKLCCETFSALPPDPVKGAGGYGAGENHPEWRGESPCKGACAGADRFLSAI